MIKFICILYNHSVAVLGRKDAAMSIGGGHFKEKSILGGPRIDMSKTFKMPMRSLEAAEW